MKQTKETAQHTFYYLLVVYTIFVLLIAFGVLHKFTFHFHILAFILAIVGISVLPTKLEEKKINKKYHYLVLAIIILLTLAFRTIPYLDNSVPLGYDPGLYKYGIESGLENKDAWILSGGMEPGFLYLMQPIKAFFSSQFILTGLFIFFTLVLGFAVYLFTRELTNARAALFSTLIYALSIVQFKAFWYLYYKNILGLALMLFSMYFLIRYEKTDRKPFLALFIILGGLILTIHRPTFYIFGISYFLYAIISPYKKTYNFKELRNNVLAGIAIIIIGGLFYLGQFSPAITGALPWVAQGFITPGESPGTFISFFSYQFSVLFYLPFALLGLFYFLKKKEFNMLAIWAIVNLAIVYFQFFFFNRFIIFLDLALIILSGVGFTILSQERKKLTPFILAVLFLSGGIIAFNESRNAQPLISEDTLSLIEKIPSTIPQEAQIMSLSSDYSPWLKGYSERTVIAPGMFDENLWSELQWNQFWTTNSTEETKALMSSYEKPIYLFAGTKTFNNPCFTLYLEETGGKIYEYAC